MVITGSPHARTPILHFRATATPVARMPFFLHKGGHAGTPRTTPLARTLLLLAQGQSRGHTPNLGPLLLRNGKRNNERACYFSHF